MKLSKEQFVQLRSAGFTERQITTMQEKFYTLLNTVELPEPAHLRNIRVLEQQVTILRDAIDKAATQIKRCDYTPARSALLQVLDATEQKP